MSIELELYESRLRAIEAASRAREAEANNAMLQTTVKVGTAFVVGWIGWNILKAMVDEL